jgi:hypothetical protein
MPANGAQYKQYPAHEFPFCDLNDGLQKKMNYYNKAAFGQILSFGCMSVALRAPFARIVQKKASIT